MNGIRQNYSFSGVSRRGSPTVIAEQKLCIRKSNYNLITG